ncbi:MAG: hypothetical protein ACREM1_05490 [Longimicrobiales bacterium]
MLNPFDRVRQQRVRQRYVPRTRVRGSVTTTRFALAVLAGILLVAAVLELHGRQGVGELLEYAEAEGVGPLDLIVEAGRRHRLLFLGDVPGAAAPKRLAAEVVDTLVKVYTLDALVLDVDIEMQPWVDRYLESNPEDASILLTNPRTLHDAEGTSSAYLELYRRVWQINQRLGADRRIRIIAADAPGWPPARPLSPSQTVAAFSHRDVHMHDTVRERVLNRNVHARVLFFMDGLHVLKGRAEVRTGGTLPIVVTPLAALLDQQFPREVYSILVDATAARAVPADVARFAATRALPVLRDQRATAPGLALRSGASLDFERNMLRFTLRPGIGFSVVPGDYRLSSLVDAYVLVGK